MGTIINEFESATNLKVSAPVAGRSLTTVAVGGQLSRFVPVENLDQLQSALAFINKNDQDRQVKIIGNGSNLLINDLGTQDWVIRLGRGFRYNHPNTETLANGSKLFIVGSNTYLPALSQKLSEEGFSGLEFAGGIPGSVGGAAYMNAGAHGGEMSEIISRVFCISPGGEEVVFTKNQLDFSYRKSGIPENFIIYQVEIQLIESDRVKTSSLRTANLQHRKATQPLTLPSFGSVFRNPDNSSMTAGQLIEKCDLKGRESGAAHISRLHGNWIVNPSKNASCEDVKSLIMLAKRDVREKYGIELHEEVVYW